MLLPEALLALMGGYQSLAPSSIYGGRVGVQCAIKERENASIDFFHNVPDVLKMGFEKSRKNKIKSVNSQEILFPEKCGHPE